MNAPGVQTVRLTVPFVFRSGETRSDIELAYESLGKLNAERRNAVLILPGLSRTTHVASTNCNPKPGWWEDIVGPGKPIDTNTFFVISPNMLGSCFGSSGPASRDPDTGLRHATDFPSITIEDNASGFYALLDELNIDRLAAVVGPSMGGHVGLAMSVMQPKRVRNALLISTAAASTPFAIALRRLQCDIIAADPNFKAGLYADAAPPLAGQILARKVGMMGYRSPEEWDKRFGRQRTPDQPELFAVESYLNARAQASDGMMDANARIALLLAANYFNLSDHADGEEIDDPNCGESRDAAALKKVQWENSLLLGVSSDVFYPFWQHQQLQRCAKAAGVHLELKEINSLRGHDAFMGDQALFAGPIAQWMAKLSV